MLQTKTELKQHLHEQLDFLKVSGARYDEGHVHAAKQLAAGIRLLAHDRGNTSRSLLGQLGLKGRRFLDSAAPRNPRSILPYYGLLIFYVPVDDRSTCFLPRLDTDEAFNRRVDFDIWWNGGVFWIHGHGEVSRKDLVLAVANQDGGTHVDPVLTKFYADLSRTNALRISGRHEDGRRHGAELASVRQIAHELLKVLEPGYRCERKQQGQGGILESISFEVGGLQADAKGRILVDINKAPIRALEIIGHIGPKRAKKVAALRRKRPFQKIDDLLQVAGIGPSRLMDIKREALAICPLAEAQPLAEVTR